MIDKLRNDLKKYRFMIISTLVILIVGLIVITIFLFVGSNKDRILNRDNYTLKYDRTWKLVSDEENYIELKHKSNSRVDIQLIELKDDQKYEDIDTLIDEILYIIRNENKSYNLISEKQTAFTKHEFLGYKVLYESDTKEALMYVYKRGSTLIVTIFEADNEYFDILLDSVNNIVYNFELKEVEFKLSHSIDIDKKAITYSSNSELENLLNQKREETKANSNYEVKYTIPSIFKEQAFNSQTGYYIYEDSEGSRTSITVDIKNVNLYEYISKNENNSVYFKYKYDRESQDYQDYTESIDEYNTDDYQAYIYKNSYYVEKEDSKYLKENIEIMYALNKNHIFVVSINSMDKGIPKKLIDMIDVLEVNNYSSYIMEDIEEGIRVSLLKRKVNDQEESIKIKLPISYNQYDMNMNIYEYKYYGVGYDEERGIYDYIVKYRMTNENATVDSIISGINRTFYDTYGKSDQLVRIINDRVYNNKTFIEYRGGYDYSSKKSYNSSEKYTYYINKRVLLYELKNGGYLVIEVSGNGLEIGEDILNTITNFEIIEN